MVDVCPKCGSNNIQSETVNGKKMPNMRMCLDCSNIFRNKSFSEDIAKVIFGMVIGYGGIVAVKKLKQELVERGVKPEAFDVGLAGALATTVGAIALRMKGTDIYKYDVNEQKAVIIEKSYQSQVAIVDKDVRVGNWIKYGDDIGMVVSVYKNYATVLTENMTHEQVHLKAVSLIGKRKADMCKGKNGDYTCKECGDTFSDPQEYEDHLNVHKKKTSDNLNDQTTERWAGAKQGNKDADGFGTEPNIETDKDVFKKPVKKNTNIRRNPLSCPITGCAFVSHDETELHSHVNDLSIPEHAGIKRLLDSGRKQKSTDIVKPYPHNGAHTRVHNALEREGAGKGDKWGLANWIVHHDNMEPTKKKADVVDDPTAWLGDRGLHVNQGSEVTFGGLRSQETNDINASRNKGEKFTVTKPVLQLPLGDYEVLEEVYDDKHSGIWGSFSDLKVQDIKTKKTYWIPKGNAQLILGIARKSNNFKQLVEKIRFDQDLSWDRMNEDVKVEMLTAAGIENTKIGTKERLSRARWYELTDDLRDKLRNSGVHGKRTTSGVTDTSQAWSKTKCPICKATFGSPRIRAKHVFDNHFGHVASFADNIETIAMNIELKADYPRGYECRTCDKIFATESDANKHEDNNEGHKTYFRQAPRDKTVTTGTSGVNNTNFGGAGEKKPLKMIKDKATKPEDAVTRRLQNEQEGINIHTLAQQLFAEVHQALSKSNTKKVSFADDPEHSTEKPVKKDDVCSYCNQLYDRGEMDDEDEELCESCKAMLAKGRSVNKSVMDIIALSKHDDVRHINTAKQVAPTMGMQNQYGIRYELITEEMYKASRTCPDCGSSNIASHNAAFDPAYCKDCGWHGTGKDTKKASEERCDNCGYTRKEHASKNHEFITTAERRSKSNKADSDEYRCNNCSKHFISKLVANAHKQETGHSLTNIEDKSKAEPYKSPKPKKPETPVSTEHIAEEFNTQMTPTGQKSMNKGLYDRVPCPKCNMWIYNGAEGKKEHNEQYHSDK